jgi:predicted small lipoprotein YifL
MMPVPAPVALYWRDDSNSPKVDDMKRLMLLLATISLTMTFTGCGQSGPLYVPGNPSTMAVPPSNSTNEDTEQEETDENAESSDDN